MAISGREPGERAQPDTTLPNTDNALIDHSSDEQEAGLVNATTSVQHEARNPDGTALLQAPQRETLLDIAPGDNDFTSEAAIAKARPQSPEKDDRVDVERTERSLKRPRTVPEPNVLGES
ncbi:hypothetical protein FVE85_0735 [Porphyridium purpureum]|uniref:Uncharacterized protein n=1 Tax=Porphyridium purpureum TaxID=35688 RepID=A0A5J4Z063_PORPP|nr:hypothetical protein FVE85_0735 [Porphyridium purpureum]|eukprot:POR5893..scf208_2